MESVPFDRLIGADLVVDRVYEGGTKPGAGSDAIFRLLPVANVGGFRIKGSVRRRDVRLVVLFSSGGEPDWPDHLDPTSGDYTYFGDNRSPGHELHDTPHLGNQLLADIFEASRSGPAERAGVPPTFLFEKTGRGRDVRFRGLLVPGSPRLTVDEELVAVWRTTAEKRFQNYRAHFTVLDVPTIERRWIEEIVAGNSTGPAAPRAWRAWVQGRIYSPLEAPRTVRVRSRTEQLPDAQDSALLWAIHRHFEPAPTQFEFLAADVWASLEKNVGSIDVTRPSRDGGRDALGELVIGPPTDPVRLSFALEAKCFRPDHGVGVKAVARLISRIKHREFGVFVTTSYIAAQAYQEVREDQHPVVFLTGRDVVDGVKRWGARDVAGVEELLRQRYPVTPEAVALEASYPAVDATLAQDTADAALPEEDGVRQRAAETRSRTSWRPRSARRRRPS